MSGKQAWGQLLVSEKLNYQLSIEYRCYKGKTIEITITIGRFQLLN